MVSFLVWARVVGPIIGKMQKYCESQGYKLRVGDDYQWEYEPDGPCTFIEGKLYLFGPGVCSPGVCNADELTVVFETWFGTRRFSMYSNIPPGMSRCDVLSELENIGIRNWMNGER